MTSVKEPHDSIPDGLLSKNAVSLSEGEEFYSALVEHAPEAILVLDANNGQIAFANETAARLYGFECHELVGVNPIELSPTLQSEGHPSLVTFAERLQHAKMGEAQVFEWLFRNASGEEMRTETRLVKLLVAAGEMVRASIVDISERKHIEDDLAHERNLLHVLMDSIPDYIYFKDTESRYTRVNRAHAKGLGASSTEEPIGKSTYDYYTAEFAEKSHADDRAIMESGQPIIARIEKSVSQDGQRVVWLSSTKVPIIDESGLVTGIVGISRDVTRLKEVEQELQDMAKAEQKSRENLELMIEQVSATVLELQSTIAQTAERADSVAEMAQRSVEVSHQGQEVVTASVESMQVILQRVKGIAENIKVLSEKTQQIGEIIATVNDIAAQSKLLALNASMEAARAGEEGKGFGVVAMEVRRLAEQSRDATNQVRNILNEIRQATANAVIATDEGSKGVDQGQNLINQAGETIQNLAAVIREVEQAMAQIADSTRHQSTGMDQLASVVTAIRSKEK